jgi:subtilase family serine protease
VCRSTTKLFAVAGLTVAMVALTLVGVSAPAGAVPASAYTSLAGSVAPFTARTAAVGDVSGTVELSIEAWLRPDMAAASSFANAVSTPGNSLYHQYLRPDRYTAQFAASQTQVRAVESWLRSEGFTDVHADSQRAYVRATAPVSTVDSAFKTQMKFYRSSKAVNAGAYALRANDRPISVPRRLESIVLGVTGLDNAAPTSTLDRDNSTPAHSTAGEESGAGSSTACSGYYGQNETRGLPEQFGTRTFPTEVCGYSATQIRAAYGANTVNTGQGVTVALVELGLAPDMFLTLQDYAAANDMPAPSSQRYSELSLGEGTACGDDFYIEEQLDVEASYDMAPGANQLVVGGDSCNDGDFGLEGLFNADQAILDGAGPSDAPLATIASNSWESGDELQPTSVTVIEHAFLVRAAAEGVGMYFSAGDGSGVEAPSSDPFAIAVGGTTLGIGSTNNRLFETGWSTAVSDVFDSAWSLLGEQGASGGGPSLLWKEPSYQKGVVPAAMSKAPGNRGAVRSAPDISADADPYTGLAVGILHISKLDIKYHQIDVGGTSEASPLVAGMVAAAQQGQTSPFGFLNPVFYKLVSTSAVNDALPLTNSTPALYRGTTCRARTCGLRILTTFDDQSFDMAGYTGQVTVAGYDNMTGIGTPNGQLFIDALRTRAG